MFIIFGEKVVMCLLEFDIIGIIFEFIGLWGNVYKIFFDVLSVINGIILVIGFIGSGKIRILVCFFIKVNDFKVNIIFFENFVEICIFGVI